MGRAQAEASHAEDPPSQLGGAVDLVGVAQEVHHIPGIIVPGLHSLHNAHDEMRVRARGCRAEHSARLPPLQGAGRSPWHRAAPKRKVRHTKVLTLQHVRQQESPRVTWHRSSSTSSAVNPQLSQRSSSSSSKSAISSAWRSLQRSNM